MASLFYFEPFLAGNLRKCQCGTNCKNSIRFFHLAATFGKTAPSRASIGSNKNLPTMVNMAYQVHCAVRRSIWSIARFAASPIICNHFAICILLTWKSTSDVTRSRYILRNNIYIPWKVLLSRRNLHVRHIIVQYYSMSTKMLRIISFTFSTYLSRTTCGTVTYIFLQSLQR